MKAVSALWLIIIVILALAVFMLGSQQSLDPLFDILSNPFHSTPTKTETPIQQETVIRPHYEKLSSIDLEILDIQWGKGDCNKIEGYTLMNCRDESFPKYPNGTCLVNTGYAVAHVSCEKDLYCEVYVNRIKSDFAPNSLQKCENEIFVAEKSFSENQFYTYLNEDKEILICCSYSFNNEYLNEYEVCKLTTIEAYCNS